MMTKTNEENLTWKGKQKQLARAWIKIFLVKWFRIEVKGQYQPNTHSVIIANRTSIIDVLLLSVFLPERLTLALHPNMFKKIWVKMLLLFTDVIVVDPGSAQATRILIRAIQAGKRCLLFPQGLLRQQEDNLKVFEGAGLVLQKTGAEVIPVRIEGAEHSIFSNSKNKHRIRFFPKITLHILPAQKFGQADNTGVAREAMSLRLFQLISDLSFANSFKPYVLFSALIEGVSIGTKNKNKIEDNNRTPLTYRQFLARCFILGRQIKKQTAVGETVGVMMPTTIAGMVTFFALQAYRRIPAMLNFSMGFYNLYSACNTARIQSIYTARQFIETARLEPLVEELQQAGIRIHYLEDFKLTIHLGNKLSGVFKGFFPTLSYRFLGDKISPDATGIILFTSGSEGKPKGVALSHANILANCWQMTSRVDFTPRDVLFNSLPIFHCFGLTAGSVLPLVNGLNCFFYPSPFIIR